MVPSVAVNIFLCKSVRVMLIVLGTSRNALPGLRGVKDSGFSQIC